MMAYRPVTTESAPEGVYLSVMWECGKRAEYGSAMRIGDMWFRKVAGNPFVGSVRCLRPSMQWIEDAQAPQNEEP